MRPCWGGCSSRLRSTLGRRPTIRSRIRRRTAFSGEWERPCRRRLLLLDAPDVDSDVAVNWRRATAIRQAADVLVAVLTQQKYNDAAVKQFFRAAVEADKPIIVVFNQCELEADRAYWPQWLETFCQQTARGRNWSTWFLTIAGRPRSCGCRSTISPLARPTFGRCPERGQQASPLSFWERGRG